MYLKGETKFYLGTIPLAVSLKIRICIKIRSLMVTKNTILYSGYKKYSYMRTFFQ